MEIRNLAAAVLLLLGGVAAVAAHCCSYDRAGHDAKLRAAAAAGAPRAIAWSQAWYEPERGFVPQASLNTYVEMPAVDTLGYLYAR